MELVTERLALRPLAMDDLDPLAPFYANPEVMRETEGDTELGATRLIALIRPGNVASELFAEKLGMRYEREIELKQAPATLYALGKAPAR